MKHSLPVLLASLTLLVAAFAANTNLPPVPPSPKSLPMQPLFKATLAWDYPTNDVDPTTSFNLRISDDVALPLAAWTLITNLPSVTTNSVLDSTGTNQSYIVTVLVSPAKHFFYVEATNTFWGTFSDPSNITNTPPGTVNPANTRFKQ